MTIKEQAVKDAKRYYGFFALLSNEKIDAIKALGLLDKLDVIECFENLQHELRIGEVSEKQKQLYQAMKVVPPT